MEIKDGRSISTEAFNKHSATRSYRRNAALLSDFLVFGPLSGRCLNPRRSLVPISQAFKEKTSQTCTEACLY